MPIRFQFAATLLAAAVAFPFLPAQPLRARAQGAPPSAPRELTVLSQSVTDSGFTVAWNKPDSYAGISDYLVTVSGAGSSHVYYASRNPSAASDDIREFYAQGVGDVLDGKGGGVAREAYAISLHSYCLSGLKADTAYTVSVKSLDSGGNVSEPAVVSQRTASAADIVSIESYGAVGDGVLADDSSGTPSSGTSNTAAIQAAINACPAGGTVLVPTGKVFATGTLSLHSHMTLDVEGTLLATTDLAEYRNPYDTDAAQTGQKSSPLIATQATDAAGRSVSYSDIRIVGGGTVNGNGWKTGTLKSDGNHPENLPIDTHFTEYMAGKVSGSDESTLHSAAAGHLAWLQYEKYRGLGQEPSKAYSTRSNLIVICNTTGVYVGDGLTVTNPSMHTLGFTACSGAVVNNATFSTYDCNNGDGINFTNGTGLTVVNSVFQTGDDSVNFNAGLGLAAESNPPTGDAWVFNNYFGRGHGVIAAGSNTAAWIENILAEDNVCNGTAVGLRCKSQSGNGGGARNIVFRDTAMANVTDNDGSAFLLTDNYAAAPAQPGPNWAPDEPCFHDLSVSNCTVAGNKKGKPSISFNGAADGVNCHIRLNNVAFGWSRAGNGPTQNKLSYLHDSEFHDVVFFGLADPWATGTGLSAVRLSGTTARPADLVPAWGTDASLTAVPARADVSLAWSAAAGENRTGYKIYRAEKTLAAFGADALSGSVTGLEPDTAYELTLYAVGRSGYESEGPAVRFATLSEESSAGKEDDRAGGSPGGEAADGPAVANPRTADTWAGWPAAAVLPAALLSLVSAVWIKRRIRVSARR